MLEGEYEFLAEGRITRASVESLFYIPRGKLHAYKNVGEESARMLVGQTPGGLHERFFEEIGEPATDDAWPPGSGRPADLKKIAAIAAEYGIEIPAPVADKGWLRNTTKGGQL